jgi:beta-xylosidase
VAYSKDPLGPFTEQLDHPLLGNGYGGVGDGVLTGGTGPFDNLDDLAIDPFLLETSKGELYLYASIFTPLAVLAAWPMSDHTTLSADKPAIVLTPDANTWEFVINEGPWVQQIDDRYLLTYSANDYTTVNYGLGAAASSQPLGPFQRVPGNPFLKTDAARGIYGPGHHAFVEGPQGELLIFYASKVSADPGGDRRIRFAEAQLGTSVTVLR